MLSASIRTAGFAQEAPVTREPVKVTASFSYRQDSRDRRISELVRSIEVSTETRRSIELRTLNQSPVTTVLELTRFLTSRGYKRADGKPLIDLTF